MLTCSKRASRYMPSHCPPRYMLVRIQFANANPNISFQSSSCLLRTSAPVSLQVAFARDSCCTPAVADCHRLSDCYPSLAVAENQVRWGGGPSEQPDAEKILMDDLDMGEHSLLAGGGGAVRIGGGRM